MKTLIYAVVAASILTAPVASFAQSNSSVTREQVRVELAQLRQAGYVGASPDAHYPDDIQAALRRVRARNATAGYGAAEAGSSQSGQRVTGAASTQSIYHGH